MKSLVAVSLTAAMAALAAQAQGNEIPMAYREVAERNGIPPAILYSIALAESGRSAAGSGVARPWPWIVNVRGQGRYLPTRRSAWRLIIAAIASDTPSVDIGLMQVNWRYHRHRLKNPWRALDPVANLSAAAEILIECRARWSDWWAAVGCYHAPSDPERAARYRDRVRAHWRTLARP